MHMWFHAQVAQKILNGILYVITKYVDNYSNVRNLPFSKKKIGKTNKGIRAMKMAKWQ